ncbi:hypothetical protein K8R78_01605 [bacterium]|nr:hypothetical protein [bacterium]
MRVVKCHNCGGRLEVNGGLGIGVSCPDCQSTSYVYAPGRAMPHYSLAVAPLNPVQLLTERLAQRGIHCAVEKVELLSVPLYLFQTRRGTSYWSAAYPELLGRFFQKLPAPTRGLAPYSESPSNYTEVAPSVLPESAWKRLKQSEAIHDEQQQVALVSLPVHRLHYRIENIRGQALAVIDRVFIEQPARPAATGLNRLRLIYGIGTGTLVLLSTVLLGGWGAALLGLGIGFGGMVALGRASR